VGNAFNSAQVRYRAGWKPAIRDGAFW